MREKILKLSCLMLVIAVLVGVLASCNFELPNGVLGGENTDNGTDGNGNNGTNGNENNGTGGNDVKAVFPFGSAVQFVGASGYDFDIGQVEFFGGKFDEGCFFADGIDCSNMPSGVGGGKHERGKSCTAADVAERDRFFRKFGKCGTYKQ